MGRSTPAASGLKISSQMSRSSSLHLLEQLFILQKMPPTHFRHRLAAADYCAAFGVFLKLIAIRLYAFIKLMASVKSTNSFSLKASRACA